MDYTITNKEPNITLSFLGEKTATQYSVGGGQSTTLKGEDIHSEGFRQYARYFDVEVIFAEEPEPENSIIGEPEGEVLEISSDNESSPQCDDETLDGGQCSHAARYQVGDTFYCTTHARKRGFIESITGTKE